MNHTTLALVAVFTARAVAMGVTFATAVALALDGSSINTDRLDASNCIGVANGGNAERELMIANEGNVCRQQDPNGHIK
jgi:hypothetical protein